jgi:hypothetical protein
MHDSIVGLIMQSEKLMGPDEFGVTFAMIAPVPDPPQPPGTPPRPVPKQPPPIKDPPPPIPVPRPSEPPPVQA